MSVQKYNPTEAMFVKTIGGYLIKVGKMYVTSYGSYMGAFSDGPVVKELSPYLGDVKELLHNEEQAKVVAETVNGKVYQLVFEPLEDEHKKGN